MPINKYLGISVKILYSPKKNQRHIFINIRIPPYRLDYNIKINKIAILTRKLIKKDKIYVK